MKIRLLILALIAAFAAGCQSGSHTAGNAGLRSDASSATTYHHHHHRAHHAARKATRRAAKKCPYPPLPSTATSSLDLHSLSPALDCKARRLAGWALAHGRAGFTLSPVHADVLMCGNTPPLPKTVRAQVSPATWPFECRIQRDAARARADGRNHFTVVPGMLVCLTSAFTLQSRDGTVGAAIQGDPERLGHPVIPGHVYRFPKVYVLDNGSAPETATLHIGNFRPWCSHVVQPSWVSGTGVPVSLDPGQHAWIPLWVRVPLGTPPGVYHSDVQDVAGVPIVPGKVNIGAAAATTIIVTVS